MTRSDFWHVIDAARDSVKAKTDIPVWLDGYLEQKPVDYIIGFAHQLRDLNHEAYDARLWAAAFVMMDFCSDDKFMDFRGWLIAQGESIYESALENPDTLAELQVIDGDYGKPILFKLLYVPETIYRRSVKDMIADIPLPKRKYILLNNIAWGGDHSKLPAMFPRLYAKYRAQAC